MGNELEEIEFDVKTLNKINELSDKASLSDSEFVRDWLYQKISILITEINEMSGDLNYKIRIKLMELLGLNNFKLTTYFYDNYLYGIFGYDTGKTGFVGRICIIANEVIVLETKDGFVYPLFKIRGDSNGQ